MNMYIVALKNYFHLLLHKRPQARERRRQADETEKYVVRQGMHGTSHTCLPIPEYPSCLHTTLASLTSQLSSQTVPQCRPLHTSTRPWPVIPCPSASLTVPISHPALTQSYSFIHIHVRISLSIHCTNVLHCQQFCTICQSTYLLDT